MKQWLFKITAYADRLLEDLKGLDWPDFIVEMQKNWIGRSEGTEIKFTISNLQSPISVFTTRPDTIFGATALVLSPEHEVVASLLNSKFKIQNSKLKKIRRYVEAAKCKSELERLELEKEKTGVDSGLFAENPASGETIPVWIADYVVGWYGLGAVMLVPAHDRRDFEFAKRYNLPIKVVVVPDEKSARRTSPAAMDEAYEGEGVLVNSGRFDGLSSEQARVKITEWLSKRGLGKRSVQYHLRDWVFSRQRYWGEPFPLVYCDKCGDENGVVPVPEGELPVELPYVKKYEPSGTGESPLATIKDWVNTKCPRCGGPARRETDTMPNWAGSCWYFLRFADPKNDKAPFDKELADYWLPVDWYVGGAEHAVLHLLYARFWTKAFFDLGLISFTEPFQKLRNVGMILAEDGRKMSKSLGNVINPDEVVKDFGADTLRLFEMFIGPFSQTSRWSTRGLVGVHRFLRRVFSLAITEARNPSGTETQKDLKVKLHRLIKKVSEDIEAMKFNTAVAALMGFVNAWSSSPQTSRLQQASRLQSAMSVEDVRVFLRLLAPFAPHITEELWQRLEDQRLVGGRTRPSIHQQEWPKYDPRLVTEGEVTIVVQVNGKLRARIQAPPDAGEEETKKRALSLPKIQKYTKGGIKRAVFVRGRLINFVT